MPDLSLLQARAGTLGLGAGEARSRAKVQASCWLKVQESGRTEGEGAGRLPLFIISRLSSEKLVWDWACSCTNHSCRPVSRDPLVTNDSPPASWL